MKKLLSVLAVLFVLGTTNVFALGIGAQGGYTINGGAGGALTLKVDSVPCVFAIDLGSLNPLSLGVTADWWIANPKLEGPLGYFYGVGCGGSLRGLGNDTMTIGIAGRVVAGLNVFFLDNFVELYLQAAWQPTIWIALGNNSNGGFAPANFPLNLGIRFWF
jgi:hypothetical protein